MLRTGISRRGVVPIHTAVTGDSFRPVRNRASRPIVIATPTVTWSMMIARTDLCPLGPMSTARGARAGMTVMPARYWPGLVRRGTVTVNGRILRAPAGRTTTLGRSDSQQLAAAQAPVLARKAEPEFVAVTPADGTTRSRSWRADPLLTIMASEADLPGLIASET
jgi:hypothetical protein